MKVGAQATGAEDQIPSPRPEPETLRREELETPGGRRMMGRVAV